MMNIGICQPEPGYLQGLADLLHKHGALLIFDEVKSGATIAAGGAVERYGVVPDLACWAKAIGGGTPAAAFGGRADVMDAIDHGAAQQGTFNGNPLVAAAGLATLTEVLTPDAYEGPRQAGHPPRRRLRPGDGRELDPRPRGGPRREGLRLLPARAAAQLPGLPRDEPGPLPRVVPVGDEPRRLHDARATRSSGRSRCSTPRRTSTATSTSSPTSAPRSPTPDGRHRASRSTGSTSRSRVEGPEDGRPVLLLHGFPDSAHIWRARDRRARPPPATARSRPTSAASASRTRPKASTRTRSRPSPWTRSGCSTRSGIEQAAVVGHDWGASVAWLVATLAPDRVERLCTVSVGHPTAFFTAGGFEQKEKSWYMLFFQSEVAEDWLSRDDWKNFLEWMHDAGGPRAQHRGPVPAGPAHRRAQLVPGHHRRRRRSRPTARAPAGHAARRWACGAATTTRSPRCR